MLRVQPHQVRDVEVNALASCTLPHSTLPPSHLLAFPFLQSSSSQSHHISLNASPYTTAMAQMAPSGPPTPPIGPSVIFIARSSKCHRDADVHGQRMWLRGTMSHVANAFRASFGSLGDRQFFYCPIVGRANNPMDHEHEAIRYLTSLMQSAREVGHPVYLVISGWAGFTTDESTFIDLLKDFEDLHITILIYAQAPGSNPPKKSFSVLNLHKIRHILQDTLNLEDNPWTDPSVKFVGLLRRRQIEKAFKEEALQVAMWMNNCPREDAMRKCRKDIVAVLSERKEEYEELLNGPRNQHN